MDLVEIIKLGNEKNEDMQKKLDAFKKKMDEVNEAKDKLINDAQGHTAEWIERQQKKLDAQLEKLQDAMDAYKEKVEKAIASWLEDMTNKITKAKEEAQKQMEEEKQKLESENPMTE